MGNFISIILNSVWRGVKNAGRLAGGLLPFVIPFIVFVIENLIKKPKTWQEVLIVDQATFWTLIIISIFYLLILTPCVCWEFIRVFPRVNIVPDTGIDDVSILIQNHEPVDLTNLNVILSKRMWITKDGMESEQLNLRNINFQLDKRNVDYMNYLVVKIANSKNGRLNFLLDDPEQVNIYETYNDLDHAIYKIELAINGRIDGKTIFPRKFTGKIIFWRTVIEKKFRTKSSKIKWEEKEKISIIRHLINKP